MIQDYDVTTVDFTIRHILHHRLSRKCTLTGYWTTNMAQNDTEANLTELFHELSWTSINFFSVVLCIPGSNWMREDGLIRKSIPATAVTGFT